MIFGSRDNPQRIRLLQIALLILAKSALTASAAAERLTLRNGNQAVGTIVAETSDKVTLRTEAGTVSFLRSTIAAIERQTDAQRAEALADEAIRRRDLAAALTAAGIKVPADARSRIDAALASAADSFLAHAPPSSADTATLRHYVENRETSAPASLKFFLARCQASSGRIADAAHTLHSLDRTFLSHSRWTRRDASDILSSDIAAALEGGQPQRGLNSLEMLAAIAPERMTSATAVLLRLTQAQRLADKGAYIPALEEIGVYVLPAAPATAWNEASRILARAERLTSAEAMADLYETAHRHFSRADFQNELLPIYERHVSALLQIGEIPEARIVAARISRIQPDTGAPFEHRVEFASRRVQTPSDDPMAQYRLGVWAREVGLEEEARSLLRLSLLHPALRDNAALQLRMLEGEVERRRFEQACSLVDAGQYDTARKALEAFQAAYPESEYNRRAAELSELARYKLWSAANVRPEEAEVLRQNAERLVLQARDDEALNLLNRIQVDFGDTDAAAQADRLRATIRSRSNKSSNSVGSAKPRTPDIEARRMAEIRRLARGLARETR